MCATRPAARRNSPTRLTGARIEAAVRRGKFLWFLLDGDRRRRAGLALSAHLGCPASSVVRGATPEPHPHCRARLQLEHAAAAPDARLPRSTHVRLPPRRAARPTADGRLAGRGAHRALLPRSVAHIARDALDPALTPRRAVNACARARGDQERPSRPDRRQRHRQHLRG